MQSYLERIFQNLLIKQGWQDRFMPEYKFHPDRKWRFDYADIENKIAVELEGGIWSRGRHTRGAGYAKDVEKYNAAVVAGWRVLRYTSLEDIPNFLADYASLLEST